MPSPPYSEFKMDTAQSDSQSLPSGTRLEEFLIERTLGSGGFGITYLATDTSLGRKVVIKENLPTQFAWREIGTGTVRPRHSAGPDCEDYTWAMRNFLREAETLASLDHPGVVRVLRRFEANGTAYFVMPFVEGVPFDEKIRVRLEQDGRFDQSELFSYLKRLLEALAYVHGFSILHRDIKPGNILITNRGNPVLIDFGAARQTISDRSMTVVESAGYTPFEQTESRGNVGAWSDLYALGCVFRKAITGQTPARSSDRIRRDQMEPLSGDANLITRFDKTFLESIDIAMRVDEHERWQEAAQWLEWLSSDHSLPVNQPGLSSQTGTTLQDNRLAHSTDKQTAHRLILPSQSCLNTQNTDGSAPIAKTKKTHQKVIVSALVMGIGVFGAWMLTPEKRPSESTVHESSPDSRQSDLVSETTSESGPITEEVISDSETIRKPSAEIQRDDLASIPSIDDSNENNKLAANEESRTLVEPKVEPKSSDIDLARQYEQGIGRPIDLPKAFELYESSAQDGNPEAAFRVALMLENGIGCKRDEGLAVARYRKAADSGHVGAQVNLGIMFAQGKGCLQSDKEAVKWYQKAAAANDRDALVLLGMMTQFGLGTAEDLEKAAELYKRAAETGDVEAQNLLEGIKE